MSGCSQEKRNCLPAFLSKIVNVYKGEGDINEFFRNQTDLFGKVCDRTPAQIERRRAVLAKRAVEQLGTTDMVELREMIKTVCAAEGIPYNGELIDRALRAAIGQRGKAL